MDGERASRSPGLGSGVKRVSERGLPDRTALPVTVLCGMPGSRQRLPTGCGITCTVVCTFLMGYATN